MQQKINEYFKKLTNKKFFKYDDEVIIGKAKDVISDLKKQIKYIKNKKNKIDKEEAEYLAQEAKDLIEEIKEKYKNGNDVIEIYLHPMDNFYCLIEKKYLYEELKEYYEEMKETKESKLKKVIAKYFDKLKSIF